MIYDPQYILMVVPSVFVRDTASLFVPYLQENPVWINAAKGIESDTLMTLTEVIEDEIVKKGGKKPRTVAISGPTHAEEVARDLPTLIVAAGDEEEVTRNVQKLFEGSCIRPYTNTDKRGVQVCGALKNVEALAVGIANGLGYGDNTKAAMITRGMEEIRRLGLAMGCNERTFFGLAGIGDLIVTATSNHSRNNRAGMLIGQGKKTAEALKEVGMVVEGVNALPAAMRLCEIYGMEMPEVLMKNPGYPGNGKKWTFRTTGSSVSTRICMRLLTPGTGVCLSMKRSLMHVCCILTASIWTVMFC